MLTLELINCKKKSIAFPNDESGIRTEFLVRTERGLAVEQNNLPHAVSHYGLNVAP